MLFRSAPSPVSRPSIFLSLRRYFPIATDRLSRFACSRFLEIMAATLEPRDDPKSHLTASGSATPRTAARPGTALEEFKDDGRPVIAIDMDDVLSQTNEVVAECEWSFGLRRAAKT